MGIKKHIINLFRTIGITFINIIGFTTFVTGAAIDNMWLLIAGLAIVDLSPSFIKTIWRDVWCQYSSKP